MEIIDILYDLARGPLVWISFLILVAGCIYRSIRFMSFTKMKGSGWKIPESELKLPQRDNEGTQGSLIQALKFTVLGAHPIMIIVSTVFHILLFAVPIFLLAHNMLLDEAVGFSLVSFPEKISDYMTMIFLAGGLFFLFRRIFVKRVRAITTLYDYIILLITTAPFITGILAYYQIYDYKIIITLHMLSGELMLVAAPFTKIFHMVFFFFGRFVLINQHTIGNGSRTW